MSIETYITRAFVPVCLRATNLIELKHTNVTLSWKSKLHQTASQHKHLHVQMSIGLVGGIVAMVETKMDTEDADSERDNRTFC